MTDRSGGRSAALRRPFAPRPRRGQPSSNRSSPKALLRPSASSWR
ncbi:hypothetical protein D779_0066 [Imhoffiella purpurea]|uniref:Uncharacterized protein n=1 Tax=Imhoffiella purpurea TaxID=1249627 RepID=W9VCQ5_9GAMM|nr:hypothetical protein D779_0066 [Imhoffiella purpurea]